MGVLDRKIAMKTKDGDGFSDAASLVVAPVLFGFVGWLIDQALGTGKVFMLALGAFGVAGSFVTAYYRHQARMAKVQEGKPWTT